MRRYLRSFMAAALTALMLASLCACALKTGEVIFETNGGSFTSEPDKDLTIGHEKELPRNITKEHATFVGWYSDPEFKHRSDIITPDEWEDITVYAKWIEHIDIIYKDMDGAVIENEQSYTRSFVPWLDDYTLPELSRDGAEFLGWYFDKALTEEATHTRILEKEESFVLYPKWG